MWSLRPPQVQPVTIFPLQCAFHKTLRWRHNGRDSVSNHQPHDCLLNRLFRRRSKKTSELRVTGLCAGNSPVIGEFPAQMACNAKNVSIWWRHHEYATNWNATISLIYIGDVISVARCHVVSRGGLCKLYTINNNWTMDCGLLEVYMPTESRSISLIGDIN